MLRFSCLFQTDSEDIYVENKHVLYLKKKWRMGGKEKRRKENFPGPLIPCSLQGCAEMSSWKSIETMLCFPRFTLLLCVSSSRVILTSYIYVYIYIWPLENLLSPYFIFLGTLSLSLNFYTFTDSCTWRLTFSWLCSFCWYCFLLK